MYIDTASDNYLDTKIKSPCISHLDKIIEIFSRQYINMFKCNLIIVK